jgi:hypothetical protein
MPEAAEVPVMLPLVIPPAPTDTVQRKSAGIYPSQTLVQRVEETEPGSMGPSRPKTEPEKPNLDDLARQVYPLVKRMIAIERERSVHC